MLCRFVLLFTLVVFAAGAGSAFADAFTKAPPSGSALPSLARVTGALFLVVALIYVTVLVFRRAGLSRRNGGHHIISVLEVLPLGSKTRLVAVQVADRVLVLGTSDTEVNTITELTGEHAIDALTDPNAKSEVPFKNRLLRLVKK